MAMSDCIKCWNTPCQCGWEFRNVSIKGLEQYLNILQQVVTYRKNHPNAKFSSLINEVETKDDKEFMDHMNNYLKGIEDASKK
jgi:CHASE3 domain sensor protein